MQDPVFAVFPHHGVINGDDSHLERPHKRDKKHKHKKHKSKDKRRSSLEDVDQHHRKRFKGYESPESGEIVEPEEERAIEGDSASDIVKNPVVDSKPRVAIKGVGAEVKHQASLSVNHDVKAASATGGPAACVDGGDKPLSTQFPVEGCKTVDTLRVVQETRGSSPAIGNDVDDSSLPASRVQGKEVNLGAGEDYRSGEKEDHRFEGRKAVSEVILSKRDDRRRPAGQNGNEKNLRSRSRSVDRCNLHDRENYIHKDRFRHRSPYRDGAVERLRRSESNAKELDRDFSRRDRERYGREKDRHERDRHDRDRDRRKRSRSRDGRYNRDSRDDKKTRFTEEQELEDAVVSVVVPEEDEEKLIEERRRRRQEILARHQQQQLQAAAVAAPTHTELMANPAVPSTPTTMDHANTAEEAPLGAGTRESTPDEDAISSGSSAEQEQGVLDIFNHLKDEVMSEVVVPDSNVAIADDKVMDDVDDMFADDGDMFADAPASKPQRKLAHAAALADAYDDAEGYYNFQVGEIMDNRYEVYESKGKGVFSTVVRARDLVRQDSLGNHPEVAVKLIRANETMYKAAQVEQMILKELAAADPDNRKHCVRMLRSFEYRNHMCLVFEPLDMNLRELTAKYGRGVGLNVKAVALYASQLLMALRHLKKCNVLHADIKPDNILVNKSRSKVKICDFGSAMHGGDNDLTPYLVSRFYRPPEVILGLKYDFAMDMWSVGCVLYELVTGQIIFLGKTNNEMLKLMMDVKGPFPRKMLKKSKFVEKHFESDPNMSFALLEEDPVTKQPVRRLIVNPTVKRNFEQLLLPKSNEADRQMMRHLADLLEKMMVLDPEKRIDPDTALRHPFVRDFASKKRPASLLEKK